MKNNFKIALTIFISIFSFSCFASTVYCPPDDAIQCIDGKCTLQSEYSNSWKISDVIGFPSEQQKFVTAFKDLLHYQPGKCRYYSLSDHNAEVILSSFVSYLRMRPAAGQGNSWWEDSQATWSCGFGNVNQADCPFNVD